MTTVSHTRTVIDCYIAPYLGHLPVGKITTQDIDDFYGHLLRWGGKRDQPLAPGSVARVHGVLHRAFAQAVRWGWISVNPVSVATPPRAQPAEIRPPGPDQVVAVLEWARNNEPDLFCYLRLAAMTGARRSQLLALRWGDVDWERAALGFTRGLAVGPRGLELRPTKTYRTYRVELDDETFVALKEYRELAKAEARKAGLELRDGAFVFSRDADGSSPWLPNWTTKKFVAARRKAGLTHFRMHDLRHFMATQMLAAGVPIVTVSQRLSHARASTTMNVYAHSVPGGDRAAAETLAAILRGARPPQENASASVERAVDAGLAKDQSRRAQYSARPTSRYAPAAVDDVGHPCSQLVDQTGTSARAVPQLQEPPRT